MKIELKKAKQAARAAKAIAKASKQKAYDLRVQETKAHLTKELFGVYRDYCQKVWIEALNLVGVHAASEWRGPQNVYHPQDL